jgi:hypothetical protein
MFDDAQMRSCRREPDNTSLIVSWLLSIKPRILVVINKCGMEEV